MTIGAEITDDRGERPDGVELIRATGSDDDVRKYIEIEESVGGPTYSPTVDEAAARADMTEGVTYFIEWRGKTIGTIVYYVKREDSTLAELEGMAVRPGEYAPYRRGDFAGVAMEHVLSELQGKGVAKVFLYVMPKNPAAISFYKKHGFRTVAENQDIEGYDGPRNRMELVLGGDSL